MLGVISLVAPKSITWFSSLKANKPMWSTCNAPSDRDYYEQFEAPPVEDDDPDCLACGARRHQAHEEWCVANRPTGEIEMEQPAVAKEAA